MTEKNLQSQISDTLISPEQLNFHPILKDIENMFWFFLLSIRALSDYDIQNILRTKDSAQEGYLCFVQMLDKFNASTNLQIKKKGNTATSNANISKEMIFMWKAMAFVTYDFLSLSSYNTIINKDNEFQFLRHIRNGAAHYNKFNLKDEVGNWKIKEDEIIRWDKLEISRKLQGKPVFNDFITLSGIFLLAKHFSERLMEIDKNKEK